MKGDIENTRLCAQAMGLEVIRPRGYRGVWLGTCAADAMPYEPLHNSADAFALVKKFKLSVGYSNGWGCAWMGENGMLHSGAYHWKTLNQAIVCCVANFQKHNPSAVKMLREVKP